MSCGAKIRGDQMFCIACGLQWDIGDKEPPKCKRNGEGADPHLKPPEVKALKACNGAWFNRKGAKYRRQGGRETISPVVAQVLVNFGLAFFSKRGSLRATTYGGEWLKRHTRGA